MAASSALDRVLLPATERLAEIAALPPDWDPYGSEPPSPVAIGLAFGILGAMAAKFGSSAGERLIPDHIAPIADGGIQIEWSARGGAFEVYISPDEVLGYLLVRGEGRTRQTEEKGDVTLHELLEKLGQVLDISRHA